MCRSIFIPALIGLSALVAAPSSASAYPEPLRAEHGPFASSLVCADCHANAPGAEAMRDAAGSGIAPFDLWSGTMMAQASRDPVWRAVVSAEAVATPSRSAEIEAACMRCHAPMASESARLDGGPPAELSWLAGGGTGEARNQLAVDGASCTICHQIRADGLGTRESLDGSFRVGDGRRIFGPHDGVNPMPMLHHTGYRPTAADHVMDSTICAPCHTLYTEPLRADGTLAGGELAEQTPWLEWQRSAYGRPGSGPYRSCQDCHMSASEPDGGAIVTAIARNPGGGDFGFARPRQPFGRHRLVGGNFLVPGMIAAAAGRLQPAADPASLEATGLAARDQLGRAARIELIDVERDRRRLGVTVVVTNLTGHKFPTGHPSRRAWLRLIVRDESGAMLFASGLFDTDGRLVDRQGRPMPAERADGPVTPHRRVIEREDHVQVYQSLMADVTGEPTWSLLRGHHYLKDNRLLPAGWRAGDADVDPVGLRDDPDFAGAGDRIRYRIPLPPGSEAASIEADLFYQPLSARYLEELFRFDTPEVRELARLWETTDRSPQQVAGRRLRIATEKAALPPR